MSLSEPQPLIADRYRVEAKLGKGGMGEVLRVVDERGGEPLALKRMLLEVVQQRPHVCALFQQEFHTLAQLRHPRVVHVHDYGIDGETPFYTMELLDGKDLREARNMPWQQVCSVLRDVCSSLALLHSRRLLHRDVGPRNVRLTSDGRAKLIDFGAMMPMGTTKTLVGTPPFVAPEVLAFQPLDGRADLFAVGALAYWVLTGKHAYRARYMPQLPEVWRCAPTELRTLRPEVPPALSELVMGLLQLDPLVRPADAAEVIDRLTAIASLPRVDQGGAARAYLTTPTVVGRRRELLAIRKRVMKTVRGAYGSVLIEGRPGLGRSRLLSSLIMEAKAAGALVIHAESQDAGRVEFAVARQLVEDALRQATDDVLEAARPHGAVLARLVPALGRQLGIEVPSEQSGGVEGSVQLTLALVRWFGAIGKTRPLVVAVDDLHRCDQSTMAALAHLAREASERSLVAATLLEGEGSGRALDVIREGSRVWTLEPLQQDDTTMLLQSVFGQVPNLTASTHWIHSLAVGNPRTTMELAQHLVDQGLASYREGTWTMAAVLPTDQLPHSLEETLDARIAALGEDGQALAETLALLADPASVPLQDYVSLMAPMPQASVFRGLDELVAHGILLRSVDGYTFHNASLQRAAQRRLGDGRRREIHRRLSERHGVGAFRDVYWKVFHLGRGGDEAAAAEHILQWYRGGNLDAMRELPDVPDLHEFGQMLEHALRYHEGRGGSRRLAFALRKVLLALTAYQDRDHEEHIPPLLFQLRHDNGLVYWEQHAGEVDDLQRIGRCIQSAQEKFDATPEPDRGLNPVEAIRETAVCVSLAVAHYGAALDVTRITSLSAYLEPFRKLSAGVEVAALFVHAATRMIRGYQGTTTLGEMKTTLESAANEMGEMELRSVIAINEYYVGMDAALLGREVALENAGNIDQDPMFGDLAWLVRMLFHLYRGEEGRARNARLQMELSVLRQGRPSTSVKTSLMYEGTAQLFNGNLMELKRMIPQVDRLAEKHSGWRPYMHGLRGHYHRERSEYAAARTQYEEALSMIGPGEHVAWPVLISSYVYCLTLLGEAALARAVGTDALDAALKLELHPSAVRQQQGALALAESALGDHASAEAHAEQAIAAAEAAQCEGLAIGYLYERRARVAIAAGDGEAFGRAASKVREHYRPSRSRVLSVRYSRLVEGARQAGLTSAPEVTLNSEPPPDARDDQVEDTEAITGDMVLGMIDAETGEPSD